MDKPQTFLGIFEGHFDPAVAVVRDGEVLAYAEEERHIRYKHAPHVYPIRALKFCLKTAGVSIEEVTAVGVNWNAAAYGDGSMQRFYDNLRATYRVDDATLAWQKSMLNQFNVKAITARHQNQWRHLYGDKRFPPIHPVPHHYTHAFHACHQSPFDQSVCLTIDGSGDQHCAVVWRHEGARIEPIRECLIPHSLGWVYAAFTEYLGFQAYDGEYKVMGLAAYGRRDPELAAKLRQIVRIGDDGGDYEVDPTYIHFGPHTYSGRYTDKLVDLLGQKPRLPDDEITPWHEDVAFAVQATLEEAAERLVLGGIRETGIRNVCIGGGVGLNVKLNSRLFSRPEVNDIFAQPLCSDGGAAVGAALVACFERTGVRPKQLRTLALGHEETDEDIERALKLAHLDYTRPDDICSTVARELAAGRIVGWFQGRMEAGPRALGQRSILADPRNVIYRDKVNAIIKFREYWRPFCPSMTAEAAEKYFSAWTDAPFMVIAFDANDRLKHDAPAIVHVDGTSRVQLVQQSVLPKFHRLLRSFEDITGVPVLLNTSFNVKGEPIVCTVQDALRTFWSTGLDVLAVGDFLVKKPCL